MLLRDIFRANLKYYRLKADISQEALAAKEGLHLTYISSVERGLRNISIDNIDRIANALGIPVIDLLRERKDD